MARTLLVSVEEISKKFPKQAREMLKELEKSKEKEKPKLPRNLVQKYTKEGKVLVKGMKIIIPASSKVPFNIEVPLCWLDDRSPEIDEDKIIKFVPSKNATKREKELVKFIQDFDDISTILDDNINIWSLIIKNKEFKDYEKRIKKWCAEIDKLKNKYHFHFEDLLGIQ